MQRIPPGQHGSRDPGGCGNLLIGIRVIQNGPPQSVFRLHGLQRRQLLIQGTCHIHIFRIQIAFRKNSAHLRHGKRCPRIGPAPVNAGHMITCDIVIAMIVKPAAGILQIFDMPVILIQCIVDHILVLVHNAHPQQQKCCHKQGVTPCLLREIIVSGHRMLQHMIRKTERIVG